MATAPNVRCPDCKHLHSGVGRCPDCDRAKDAARGGTTARGYGYRHKKLSALQRAGAIGDVCFMCGSPMLADQPLALDHTPDRSAYRGVVHLGCNASDGASRATKG